MMRTVDTGRRSSARTRRNKKSLLGPAVIVGALVLGPGATVSAATVGADYGYKAIWPVMLATACMLSYTNMATRIGVASRESPLTIVRQSMGRVTAAVIAMLFYASILLFMAGSLVGSAFGLALIFGGSVAVWTVVSVGLALVLFWLKNAYKALEKAMILAITVMVLVFAATAIMAGPNWLNVAGGFIPDDIPGGSVAIFALIGTTFSTSAALYAAYTTRDKGVRFADYRRATFSDTFPGILATGVIVIFIIVAGAAVMSGREIDSAVDIARILAPAVGVGAAYVFAVGVFAAGFSSVTGNAASGGAVLADGFDVGRSLSDKTVKILGSISMIVGGVVVVVFGKTPVGVILVGNAVSLFLSPALAVTILCIANSKTRMGKLRNKIWHNVFGAVGLAVIVYSAVQTAIELLGTS